MIDILNETDVIVFPLSVGVVSTEDLGRVMNAFALTPSQDELHNMITEVDGSGELVASGERAQKTRMMLD